MRVNNTLRAILKDLLPPIILKKLQARNASIVYQSYASALADADGYEDKDLVKVVVAKGKIFRDALNEGKQLDLLSLRTVIALAASLRSKKLKVIDFGGAAGTHFFIAKALLGTSVELDWRVVETPEMVRAANTEGLSTRELSFYDSLDKAVNGDEFDIIFSSCAVNYAPNPYEILDEIVKVDAKYLVLTRTPVADNESVLLQYSMLRHNGVGGLPEGESIVDRKISYPVTILERRKVEQCITKFGEILLYVEEDKGAYQSKYQQYDMWGYVVKR